jgi:hypothetical protein
LGNVRLLRRLVTVVQIRLEPTRLENFDLVEEEFLGGPPSDGLERGRRATVARPVVELIGPELVRADAELLRFLERSSAEFYLAHFRCSLGVGPRDELEEATVRVDLGSEEGEAVAWSLSPLRLVQRVPRDHVSLGAEISLGPMFKIRGDWAPLTEREECYVYALGEGESDPEWRYRRTAHEQLLGVHDMTMVVQVPPNRGVHGTVQITARVRHRGILVQTVVPLPQDFARFQLHGRTAGG